MSPEPRGDLDGSGPAGMSLAAPLHHAAGAITGLDLDSALQEIVEDAVIDGFTPGQAQRISDRTDNMQVFETLRDLPSPVRVAGQFPESGRILPPCSAYPRLLAAPCTEPQLWDRASSGMDSGGRPH